MSSSTLCKLPCGCYAVTLVLQPHVAAFAEEAAKARGFENADALLQLVLNNGMAIDMFDCLDGRSPPHPYLDEDDLPF
jgi:hypothetical protein